MAMHIEQPGSRHSAPASRKMRSRPSASASRFTAADPARRACGAAPCAPSSPPRPRGGRAREFVQLPMKTTSTAGRGARSPGAKPMYAERALQRGAGRRRPPACAGSGTAPVIGIAWAGFVPQVIDRLERGGVDRDTSRSKRAPASLGSARQRATACSQASPRGAFGRPERYWNVVSSGAIMPARAPISMDMLETVMRASIVRARMAGPAYSATSPVPPPTPSFAMMARMRSFAPTPAGSRPSTFTRSVLGRRCSRHWAART